MSQVDDRRTYIYQVPANSLHHLYDVVRDSGAQIDARHAPVPVGQNIVVRVWATPVQVKYATEQGIQVFGDPKIEI